MPRAAIKSYRRGRATLRSRQALVTRNLSANRSVKARYGYASVPRSRGPMVTGEMKYYDSTKSSTAIAAATDWTGCELDPTTSLFAPSVGGTINQRIGRKVHLKSLRIRGIVGTAPSTTGAAYPPCQIRLLLVLDMQTNATQLNSEDVMQAPSTATALACTNSRQALSQLGRFRVLKDKTFVIQDPNIISNAIAGAGRMVPFKFNIPLKNMVVTFNAAATGGIGDIVDNSFHIIACASDSGMNPFIQYEGRVTYKE